MFQPGEEVQLTAYDDRIAYAIGVDNRCFNHFPDFSFNDWDKRFTCHAFIGSIIPFYQTDYRLYVDQDDVRIITLWYVTDKPEDQAPITRVSGWWVPEDWLSPFVTTPTRAALRLFKRKIHATVQ